MILGFSNRDGTRCRWFRKSGREWRKMRVENDRGRRRARSVFRSPRCCRWQTSFGLFAGCRRKDGFHSRDRLVVISEDLILSDRTGSLDLFSLFMRQCTSLIMTPDPLEIVRTISRRSPNRFESVSIFGNRSIHVRDAVCSFSSSTIVDVDIDGLEVRMRGCGLSDTGGTFRHEEFEDFAVLTERVWSFQLLKGILIRYLGRHTLYVHLSSLSHPNVGFELNPLSLVFSPLVSQLLCRLQPFHFVWLDRLEFDRSIIVRSSTGRATIIQVLLDVMVAESTDLVTTRTRFEVEVG